MDIKWQPLAIAVLSSVAAAQAQAQQSRGYAGGAMALASSTQPTTTQRVGGSTWSGSIVVGARVSRRLSVEFEPTFMGELSAERYSYRPSLDRVANVESNRHDRFFSVQLRGRIGALEPVAGVSYVRATTRRLATLATGGQTYFEDEQSWNGIALTGGLDAAIGVSPRVAVVPTLRLFVVSRPSPSSAAGPPVGSVVLVRAGIGGRVTF